MLRFAAEKSGSLRCAFGQQPATFEMDIAVAWATAVSDQ